MEAMKKIKDKMRTAWKKYTQGEPFLIAIFTYAVFMTIAFPVFYFERFHGALSDKQEIWGQFGEYVGGTVGPLLSLLTFFLLLITYRAQTRELTITRDELKQARTEAVKADIFRMIELLASELAILSESENRKIIAINGSTRSPYTYKQIFSAWKDENLDVLRRLPPETGERDLAPMLATLKHFYYFLSEYERIVGNDYATRYFKDLYHKRVEALFKVGLVTSQTQKFFSLST